MIKTLVGQRVGAVSEIQDGEMKLFGYGVYEGDFIPDVPDDEDSMPGLLKKADIPNPKIKLDNGDVVYGCECWWGDEDKIKEMENKCTSVQIVSIKDFRDAN